MDTTPNLSLPYLMAAQAQKHVTHNEALRMLDAVVQLAVLDRDLATPPTTPANGDRYIVAAGATGAWSGHDLEIAAYQDGAWEFYAAAAGWTAWATDEDTLLAWNGAAWIEPAGGAASLNPAPLVGVNTTADAANRLAVKSNAVLLSHDDVTPGTGDMRTVLNKSAANKTASFVFQSAWSGRAEIGLAGSDDFSFKVSPDGSAWYDAIFIDRTSGVVSFPSTTMREVLTADRTYYVSPSGNNNDTGLSSGAPLATILEAIARCYRLDTNGYAVTIQLMDGTHVGPTNQAIIVDRPLVGGARLRIQGNATTPGNVVVQGVYPVATFSGGGKSELANLRLQSSSNGSLVSAIEGHDLYLSGIEWGTCQRYHIEANTQASITLTGNDSIVTSDTLLGHISLATRAVFGGTNRTTTLTGTPNCTLAFLNVVGGDYGVWNHTFSGSGTGKRYNVTLNGTANTFGKGVNHFPGDVAGGTATGGQYA